ncbi:MAG: ABC transporter permease [Bacteroidota bacterium]|jgi:putative ABC transport system permease protein
MLRNYVKIALRNILRHKGYSLINISGLSIGMAACILILLYVYNELSYDSFHEKKDRIYRVVTDAVGPESPTPMKVSTNGWPLGRVLRSEFPEFERVIYARSWGVPVRQGDNYFYENTMFAEDGFFDIFTFPFLEGDPKTALRDPFTVVISQSMKKKYFGDSPALGESIVLGDTFHMTVTGVMADVPTRSHLEFDILASFATFSRLDPNFEKNEGWFNWNMYNYALVREGVNMADLEKKVAGIYMTHAAEVFKSSGYQCTVKFQPLGAVYLDAGYANRLGPTGNASTVYVLLLVACFILLIAAINFMNLSTARSMLRGKEVGIRKAVGSARASLVLQFLAESFCTTAVSFIIALVLVGLFLPPFNELVGKKIGAGPLMSIGGTGVCVIFVVLVGLLAGSYPAVVLSGFRPIDVLKGRTSPALRGKRLRQFLVIGQFAISCFLMISTLMVLKQLRFMQSEKLGFAKEQVLVLDAKKSPWDLLTRVYETFKNDLLSHPGIVSTSAAWAFPGHDGWRGQIAFPEGGAKDASITIEFVPVDHDYARTMSLTVIAGRDFSRSFATDPQHAFLVNETAVKIMGWGTPQAAVGKKLATSGVEGEVVGVVKDYHQHGLQERIGPIALAILPAYAYFAIRFNAGDATGVVAHAQSVWKKHFGGYPSAYFFLDEDFDRQYRSEERLGAIAGIFSGLAIFIACLGLFGLAAFMVDQRAKEIGIRKVLGASIPGVALMLSKEFALWVVLANLLAWPLAYYVMKRWLEGFAYRMAFPLWVFPLVGVVTLAIAFVTVSFQSVKVARANPVDSLRYE